MGASLKFSLCLNQNLLTQVTFQIKASCLHEHRYFILDYLGTSRYGVTGLYSCQDT